MNEPVPTLAALLAKDDGGDPDLDSAVFESNQSVKEVFDGIHAIHGAVSRRGVARAALDGLASVFSAPVATILAGAWNAHRALAAYADPKRHPPEEVHLVPIAQHTIESTYKPEVEVLLDGAPLKTIQFELTLELELQAAVLKIQGGKIRELELGSCKGKGKLTCEGATLAERESREIRLPGSISFGDGIAIRSSDGA